MPNLKRTGYWLSLIALLTAGALLPVFGRSPQTTGAGAGLQQRCTFSDGGTVTLGHEALGETAQGAETWQTGRYQATIFAISEPMRFPASGQGFDIPAGTYTLFVIPSKGSWPMILSKAAKWGAGYPGPSKDLGRSISGYDILNPPRNGAAIGCFQHDGSPMFIWMESGNQVGYAKLIATPVASDGSKKIFMR
jgi:hypothetical protein